MVDETNEKVDTWTALSPSAASSNCNLSKLRILSSSFWTHFVISAMAKRCCCPRGGVNSNFAMSSKVQNPVKTYVIDVSALGLAMSLTSGAHTLKPSPKGSGLLFFFCDATRTATAHPLEIDPSGNTKRKPAYASGCMSARKPKSKPSSFLGKVFNMDKTHS